MSQPVISDSLEERWQAYVHTHVRVQHPRVGAIEVRPVSIGNVIGEFPDEAGRTIHVLTAHNPGRQLSVEDNNRRQSDLIRIVGERTHIEAWPALGGDPQWQHAEDSIAAVGMTDSEALELARRFDQDAIFSWTPQSWRLLSCDGDREHESGWASHPTTGEDGPEPYRPS
jgi:hypothetical protein